MAATPFDFGALDCQPVQADHCTDVQADELTDDHDELDIWYENEFSLSACTDVQADESAAKCKPVQADSLTKGKRMQRIAVSDKLHLALTEHKTAVLRENGKRLSLAAIVEAAVWEYLARDAKDDK